MTKTLSRLQHRLSSFYSSTHVYVIYAVKPEDLMTAGCVTAEMVAPYQHGQGVPDADGDSAKPRVSQRAGYAFSGPCPSRSRFNYRASRSKRFSQSRLAWREQISKSVTPTPWEEYPDISAYERPRPQLRLVIDNTHP